MPIASHRFSIKDLENKIARANFYKDIKNDDRIERKSFLKKKKVAILDVKFFAENGYKNENINT